MADLTFDAVICGGGNKALMLAMYLTRYAGMSVGIFERRHEIGGGLATEEMSAPGFRGNTHANIMLPWYFAPLWRDFPEFWDYGGQFDQYLVSDGGAFMDNETCLAIYSSKHDPTQQKTIKEIARFSEKDAEMWGRATEIVNSDDYLSVMLDGLLHPHEWQMKPEFLDRQVNFFTKYLAGTPLEPTAEVLEAAPIDAVKHFFESSEVQYCILRFIISSARNVLDPNQGQEVLGMLGTLPTIGFARGGTHQIAHACHQVLVQDGCKFFTHAEVEKILHENGKATGIRLTDGSEIAARKVVISAGLSTSQLADMVGDDIFGQEHAHRMRNLSTNNIGNLMWYSFALNEAPKYRAEAFNPDIHECMWLGLSTTSSPEHMANECRYANKGKLPPLEDFSPVVGCHSLVDHSFAPPGKHVAQNEMQGPRATDLSEKDWLELKKKYTEDMLNVWQKYAPNMNWDNLIGCDTNSPWDCVRMKNLAPHGNFSGIDQTMSQRGANRPTPELANHRTPISNLYATGGFWHVGSNASVDASYNCYKIMADDMGLPRVWEEQGKEEPDSLVYWTRWAIDKAREAYPRDPKY
ncbi:MAG: NAD(P)/FAD-dependent oxidoreductase [Dehalococcoidia bacterium]